MDDFILICESREHLEYCLECIQNILAGMHMELSPTKTKIYTLKEGFKFLGFNFRLTDTGKVVITIDPKKVKNEKRKLVRMAGLVRKGRKTREQVDEHFESWKVDASYGDSYTLIDHMNEFYKNLWEDEDDVIQEIKDNGSGSPREGTDGSGHREAGSPS
jgi:hypothetical protein